MVGEGFVWVCGWCEAVYGGDCVAFLYSDESGVYCPCGGRLEEGVGECGGFRVVIPEALAGGVLARELSRLASVEVGETGGRVRLEPERVLHPRIG